MNIIHPYFCLGWEVLFNVFLIMSESLTRHVCSGVVVVPLLEMAPNGPMVVTMVVIQCILLIMVLN